MAAVQNTYPRRELAHGVGLLPIATLAVTLVGASPAFFGGQETVDDDKNARSLIMRQTVEAARVISLLVTL